MTNRRVSSRNPGAALACFALSIAFLGFTSVAFADDSQAWADRQNAFSMTINDPIYITLADRWAANPSDESARDALLQYSKISPLELFQMRMELNFNEYAIPAEIRDLDERWQFLQRVKVFAPDPYPNPDFLAAIGAITEPETIVVPFAPAIGTNRNTAYNYVTKPLAYDGEIQIGVNPSNAFQIVAAANTWDTQGCASGIQSIVSSIDGGVNWRWACAPGVAAYGLTCSTVVFGSDPGLYWDRNSGVHLNYMLLCCDASCQASTANPRSAIVNAKSVDAGLTWNAEGVVVNNFATTAFDDKNFLIIDNNPGSPHLGREYVCWDTNNVEKIAYSDTGLTGSWTTVILPATARPTNIGCEPALASDGTLHMVWEGIAGCSPCTSETNYYSRSTDGGNTWSAPVVVTNHNQVSFGTQAKAPAADNRGTNPMSNIDRDNNPSSPCAGTMYVAYSDFVAGGSTATTDVFVKRSVDNGATWGAPVKVNDDATARAQFHPWLAVDQTDGTVVVGWHDARNDANNRKVEYFVSRSSDCGLTFEPNILASTASAEFSNAGITYADENTTDNAGRNPNQYGEYMGVNADNRVAYLAWCDSRQFFPANTADTMKENIGFTKVTFCSAPSTLAAPTLTAGCPALQVTVSWAAPASWGTNATGGTYTVERATSGSGPWTPVASGLSATSYVDGSVSPATPYWYRIVAKNNCPGTTLTPMTSTGASASVGTGPLMPTASNNGPICAHGVLSLSASATGLTYSWTGPNGFSSTLQSPSILNATAAATGTYSVTATANGCTSPAATTAATVIDSGQACSDGNACTVGDVCAVPNVVNQSFDLVTAPTLPPGWSTTATGGTPWTTTTAFSVSAPNSATTDTPPSVSDKTLETPPFFGSYGAILEFDNRYNLESTYDGAVLEIRVGAGPFTDIVSAGGAIVAGGYNAVISTSFLSPIGGRQAWSGASPGFVHTIVNLPPAAAGQTVTLRFRVASDSSVAAAPPNGQWIDNVVVRASVCQPGPTNTCDDANVCTDDSCDPVSGCVHTNNSGACNDGNACTTGDTCRGGVCGGGTTDPVEYIVNGGFETGSGATDCGPNAFLRDAWTGTGSAIQFSGCPWTPSGVAASLGYPGGNSPGTFSQTFAATPGPGTLSYQHGAEAPILCSYTVTFGPSNTVVPVNVQLPAGLMAAATIAVPAGTTSVTFGDANCTGGPLDLLQFDNVSLTAGVATFLDCNDSNVCTDDSCNPATGCVYTNNTAACNDANACTVGDTCRGGACGGGTTTPVEDLANNGFETGPGVTDCNPNPFQRDAWTGTGSAMQHSGCGWTGPSITASLGYLAGNTPGTISQTFAATPGPGTLTYQHGSYGPGSCSYTVTFGPSNTAVPVNVLLPAGLIAAASIAVPAGTTSVTFGDVDCTAGGLFLMQFDNVSLTAGVATLLDCNDQNACTDDSCDPASGCLHTNNTGACNDGNACTVGDTCRGGVCGGGTSAPAEDIVNGGFETGAGATGCGPNPFLRDSWTGTGSAIEHSGCGWTGPSITASLGYPAGNTLGTISQTFSATPGPGTLTYQHGSYNPGSCSYTVTFGPSNTVVPVNASFPAGLTSAASIAVPAGTTSVTFGNVDCTASGLQFVQFDDVSLTAGVATFLACNDLNVCTDDSCNPAVGCVYANNTSACDDGNACTVGDICAGGVCSGTAITPPPEAQNVRVAADKATFSWAAAASATRYDVVRGSMAAFPVGPGGGDEVCFDNLPGTTLTDPIVPAPGTGFFYLSRGENACGNGTFGTQGVHGVPGALRVTTTCP